jgi:hypothetical protein
LALWSSTAHAQYDAGECIKLDWTYEQGVSIITVTDSCQDRITVDTLSVLGDWTFLGDSCITIQVTPESWTPVIDTSTLVRNTIFWMGDTVLVTDTLYDTTYQRTDPILQWKFVCGSGDGCTEYAVVPLGCWETRTTEVKVDSGVVRCDTACYVIEAYNQAYWLFYDDHLAWLEEFDKQTGGTGNRDCNDPNIWCIEITGEEPHKFEAYWARDGKLCDRDSVFCFTGTAFAELFAWLQTNGLDPIEGGTETRTDTNEVDCEEYAGWETGEAVTPNQIMYKVATSCDTSDTYESREVQVWVDAGGDTTVAYNACLYECPKFVVTCTNGGWDSSAYTAPVYETTTVYDTADCYETAEVFYPVPIGYDAWYSPAQVTWNSHAEWEAWRKVRAVVRDTISPFDADKDHPPAWMDGYIPFVESVYMIEWNDETLLHRRQTTPGVRDSLDRTAFSWYCAWGKAEWQAVMKQQFNHSWDDPTLLWWGGILEVYWVPEESIDSLCQDVADSCIVFDVEYGWVSGTACSKDTVMYIYCEAPYGPLLVDSVEYQIPDIDRDSLITERVTYTIIGTETRYVRFWNEDLKTRAVTVTDSCRCDEPTITVSNGSLYACDIEFVNLCPGGPPIVKVDNNTIGFWQYCPDEDLGGRLAEVENRLDNQDAQLVAIAADTSETTTADAWTTSSETGDFTAADKTIHFIDAGGGASITVTLPSASAGTEFVLKRTDDGSGGGMVTIDGEVDGSPEPTLSAVGASDSAYRIASDGTAWYFIGKY